MNQTIINGEKYGQFCRREIVPNIFLWFKIFVLSPLGAVHPDLFQSPLLPFAIIIPETLLSTPLVLLDWEGVCKCMQLVAFLSTSFQSTLQYLYSLHNIAFLHRCAAMSNAEVATYVVTGGLMSNPDGLQLGSIKAWCPPKLYDVMCSCWKRAPQERLTFDYLKTFFEHFDVTTQAFYDST